MSLAHRPCPVCLSTESSLLFKQTFASFSEKSLMEGYDLVICQGCGAGFADLIPLQEAFDAYYSGMSKYGNTQRDGAISPSDQERFQQVVDIMAPHVEKRARIADVGCATGGLLAEFKKRGFTNLVGFDPSAACVEIAVRLHGLDVRHGAISDLVPEREKFDAIILTGVLEHIRDLEASLKTLRHFLNPGGKFYFEVPDATRYHEWFSAPFQFFSMEHVNFFSPSSLAHLMGRLGFAPVSVERVKRFLSPGAVEPAVAGLFADTGATVPRKFDHETRAELTKYIESSRALEARINKIIQDLSDSKTPCAVWGTGTHTLRLLRTSALDRANIVAFLDSNPNYQGKTLRDVPIISPDHFPDRDVPILISSHVAEREIRAEIQVRRKWSNPVICLYENAPVEAG